MAKRKTVNVDKGHKPSILSGKNNIAWRDASGSISKEILEAFLGEVKDIMTQSPDFTTSFIL